MQKILATRQRVVKISSFLSQTLSSMPSSERKVARECVTEGACATLTFSLALLQLLFPSYALSLSRLRRQLPPGGSL